MGTFTLKSDINCCSRQFILYIYSTYVRMFICKLYLHTIVKESTHLIGIHCMNLIQHTTGADSLSTESMQTIHMRCAYFFHFALRSTSAHVNIWISSLTSLMSITLLPITNTSTTSYSTGTIASISCINVLAQ